MIVNVGISTSGKTLGLLKGSFIKRCRYAHEVTLSALNKLLRNALFQRLSFQNALLVDFVISHFVHSFDSVQVYFIVCKMVLKLTHEMRTEIVLLYTTHGSVRKTATIFSDRHPDPKLSIATVVKM